MFTNEIKVNGQFIGGTIRENKFFLTNLLSGPNILVKVLTEKTIDGMIKELQEVRDKISE